MLDPTTRGREATRASSRVRNRIRLARAFLSGSEPVGAAPTAALVETTTRCNLECPMCARQLASGSWPARDISMTELDAALDALGPLCELVLPYGGGEPLLHPDIAAMISRCTERGFATELATNATLLSGRISRDLILAGLDTLIISLDATRAATYGRIRRGADYDRTCSNIMRFLQAKRRLGARTWVVIQMIDLPENRGEGVALRRKWRRVAGVDAVRVKADEVHIERAIEKRPGPRPRRHACYFLWLGPALVRHDGAVYPCCHLWRGEPVGQIGRQSLAEIWNGPAMKRLRRVHLEGRADVIPSCRECQAVVPHHLLVAGSLLVPPKVTRRVLPWAETVNRLVGGRWISSR